MCISDTYKLSLGIYYRKEIQLRLFPLWLFGSHNVIYSSPSFPHDLKKDAKGLDPGEEINVWGGSSRGSEAGTRAMSLTRGGLYRRVGGGAQ